jgi:hypothetical protein
MADGSVLSMTQHTEPVIFRAHLTIAGNEVLQLLD